MLFPRTIRNVPSYTTAFFILLIIAAGFASVSFGINIGRSIGVMTELPGAEADVSGGAEGSGRFDNAPRLFLELIVPAVSLAIFLAAAIAMYYRFPSKLLANHEFTKTPNEGEVIFIARVTQLARHLFDIQPVVYLTSAASSAHAQAFGAGSRKSLLLGGGLRLLSLRHHRKAEAIILHELGHIANKDVSKAYVALSVWRTFAAVFALPLIFILLAVFFQGIFERLNSGNSIPEITLGVLTKNFPALLLSALQTITLFSLIIYFRNKVLRTREFFADLRASECGYATELSEILLKSGAKQETGLKKFLSFHPAAEERINVIKNPCLLLNCSKSDAFFAGLLSSIIANSMVFPSLTLASALSHFFAPETAGQNVTFTFLRLILSAALPVLIVLISLPLLGFPMAGSIGLQSMGSSFGRKFQPEFVKRTQMILCLLFVAGYELGFLVQPLSSLIPKTPAQFAAVLATDALLILAGALVITLSNRAGEKYAGIALQNKPVKELFVRMVAVESLIASVAVLAAVILRIVSVLSIR